MLFLTEWLAFDDMYTVQIARRLTTPVILFVVETDFLFHVHDSII